MFAIFNVLNSACESECKYFFIDKYLNLCFRITVGVRLLRKMGWKEGQGLGPRMTKKQKRSKKMIFNICMTLYIPLKPVCFIFIKLYNVSSDGMIV